MKEGSYYSREEKDDVRCELCPHFCRIHPDKSGICGARKNIDGKLITRNYGIVPSAALDPIEKKPLYHFYPGSQIFSIGTVGCNMRCPFCQNYSLSRFFDNGEKPLDDPVAPEDVVRMLDRETLPGNTFAGIAYTYSEPMVWFEFVRDTSRLMKEKGGMNVLVTNGYINPKPLDDLIPLVSAANVDLKAFNEKSYARMGGTLAPVLASIEKMKQGGWHVELTTLMVTGLSDKVSEIEDAAKWIASIDRKIPYHLSRYFPQYKYNEPATDIDLIHEARAAARAHLDYVYMGNTGNESDTECPSCGNTLVIRNGYHVRMGGIKEGKCSKCGRDADIVM
ncbi:MAG TPA: AmmeMemoRadiSam system radical SAM enzyme [Spirochaetota bacterium]